MTLRVDDVIRGLRHAEAARRSDPHEARTAVTERAESFADHDRL
jgi:hypothetical protein